MIYNQFKNMLYEVLSIAINAGRIIMRLYGQSDFSTKDDNSPLTQADLESHTFIIRELSKHYPYKICSEEATLTHNERKDLEYYWLIDPLDGTKDFLAQNGNFTINIALIHRNIPILGVIYAPALHEAYMALKGFGSYGYNITDLKEAIRCEKLDTIWLDSHKIPLRRKNLIHIYGENLHLFQNMDSKIHEIILKNYNNMFASEKQKSILIACDSMFHSTKETRDFIESLQATTLKRGSSLKLCALASGLADLYPRFNGTSEWDTAAGHIILHETGGDIINIETKKSLSYNKANFRNSHFIALSKKLIDEKFIGRIFEHNNT
ncbi:3'(2'),5'-bisphosphate nucleotidase CysQ [Helicobacter didelphidarum]|uniref:3'(2'),5'-bisphosphate nucleotidase CysQ n=1 Tax=Helicobacter didelphidarum TaxID=2040648 RepID=A0A3D8IQX2_9HELI|nr:inositol monophosphatase family protein [Helicobacter didelphidarum]RDU67014.1 3'(2'),5'-bisphosphate nucleotidase CysQ [Helicobacter didelphidarum]